MSDPQIEEHSPLIKTPRQLVIVILMAFLVPILGIVLLVQLITGGMDVDRASLAMTEQAIAARLKPVGEVVIRDANSPAPIAAVTSDSPIAAPGAAAGDASDGEKVYKSVCTACHGTGIAGAPKVGDKAVWKARIAQGGDTLYTHAIKGIRMMPPKGGATSASDADVKAAVDYMVAHSR